MAPPTSTATEQFIESLRAAAGREPGKADVIVLAVLGVLFVGALVYGSWTAYRSNRK